MKRDVSVSIALRTTSVPAALWHCRTVVTLQEAVVRSLRSSGGPLPFAHVGFWMAAAISAGLVLLIPVVTFGWGPGLLERFLLTRENNVGAWWSGMLLFVLALNAWSAGLARRSARASRAWASIGFILLFLSADEVGSMHERLGILGDALGVGSWGLILPLGAVVGAVLLHALYVLWQQDGPRLPALLLMGFAMLGSVAVQEVLEHRLVWETLAANAIRDMIEEGTELVGMLLLLAVITPETFGKPSERRHAGGPLAFAESDARAFLIAAALVVPVFTVIGVLIGEDGRGRLTDWLAAVGFMSAALLALRPLAGRTLRSDPWLWPIAGLCILASIACVAVGPARQVELGGLILNERLLVLGAATVLVCVGWLAFGIRTLESALATCAIAIWAVVAPFLAESLREVFVMGQILAIMVAAESWLSLQTAMDEERGETIRASPRVL
jgi:hypothetical protein